ncbi:hypothetical protein CYMTET_43924, partial [Cymbomonas tetramitiformis]
ARRRQEETEVQVKGQEEAAARLRQAQEVAEMKAAETADVKRELVEIRGHVAELRGLVQEFPRLVNEDREERKAQSDREAQARAEALVAEAKAEHDAAMFPLKLELEQTSALVHHLKQKVAVLEKGLRQYDAPPGRQLGVPQGRRGDQARGCDAAPGISALDAASELLPEAAPEMKAPATTTLGKRKAPDSLIELVDLSPGTLYIGESAMTEHERRKLHATNSGKTPLAEFSFTMTEAAQKVFDANRGQAWKAGSVVFPQRSTLSTLLPQFPTKAALCEFVRAAVRSNGDGQVEVGLIQDTSDPCFGGLGLFATRALDPWELKLSYPGVCKTGEQFELETDRDAANELDHMYGVDLECTRRWGGQDQQLIVDAWRTSGRARFINDHRRDLVVLPNAEQQQLEPRRHNTLFCEAVADGTPCIFVINSLPISKGEQLLVEYGDAFVTGLHAAIERTQGLEESNRELIIHTRIQVKKEFGII